MKVDYCSDLHFEFDHLLDELPGGDVLLLAGDIMTKSYANIMKNQPGKRERIGFWRTLPKYKHVLYIPGNHEAYNADVDETTAAIKSLMSEFPNVTYIPEPQAIVIENTTFLCASLWTDFAGGNPLTMELARNRMNDYRCIVYKGRALHPQDVLDWHIRDRNWLATELAKPGQKVVMTHHAPSTQGLSEDHSSPALDPMYYTYLEPMIETAVDLPIWVHGHTHIQKKYKIGDTEVLSNARGYMHREWAASIFKIRSFEL